MCRPDHFQVEYVINPWMKKGSVDVVKAKKQWQELVDTYTSLGIQVEVIAQKPELPDMVFTADQALIIGKTAYLSHFRFAERQPESAVFEKWFLENGYSVQPISDQYYFEGGECVHWQDMYFVGTGFRAQKEACPQLAEMIKKTVQPLTLIDERFYHLDTCLLVLDDENAFYYPQAFDSASQKLLLETIPNLIEFTESEALGFAANSVVTERTVITQKGNERFFQKLHALKYQPIEIDISEFIKSGGGIHCLTLEV